MGCSCPLISGSCRTWASLPVAHALPHRPQAAPTGSSGLPDRTGKARLPAGKHVGRSKLRFLMKGFFRGTRLGITSEARPEKTRAKLGRQSKSTIVCQESGLVSPRTACKFISSLELCKDNLFPECGSRHTLNGLTHVQQRLPLNAGDCHSTTYHLCLHRELLEHITICCTGTARHIRLQPKCHKRRLRLPAGLPA